MVGAVQGHSVRVNNDAVLTTRAPGTEAKHSQMCIAAESFSMLGKASACCLGAHPPTALTRRAKA